MTKYPLAQNGVFWTLQGEGALLGTPMAFVRLAGCSIGCAQCDTDYRVAERVTAENIHARVQQVVPPVFSRPWVWITGGEPTDHDIAPLCDLLKTAGFRVAIATAGMKIIAMQIANFVSVSPHRSDFVQRWGTELKIVPELNGLKWEDVEEMGRGSFAYRFIQPLAGSSFNERNCLAWVMNHPGWQLTLQAHKHWQIP